MYLPELVVTLRSVARAGGGEDWARVGGSGVVRGDTVVAVAGGSVIGTDVVVREARGSFVANCLLTLKGRLGEEVRRNIIRFFFRGGGKRMQETFNAAVPSLTGTRVGNENDSSVSIVAFFSARGKS